MLAVDILVKNTGKARSSKVSHLSGGKRLLIWIRESKKVEPFDSSFEHFSVCFSV